MSPSPSLLCVPRFPLRFSPTCTHSQIRSDLGRPRELRTKSLLEVCMAQGSKILTSRTHTTHTIRKQSVRSIQWCMPLHMRLHTSQAIHHHHQNLRTSHASVHHAQPFPLPHTSECSRIRGRRRMHVGHSCMCKLMRGDACSDEHRSDGVVRPMPYRALKPLIYLVDVCLITPRPPERVQAVCVEGMTSHTCRCDPGCASL